MLKKDIPVIKLRWYAWALAVVLMLAGGISFAVLGGFNLGVDFESGLSQRIQIAPIGLEVTYTGNKDAVLAISGSGLTLEVRGDEGVSSINFSASEYPTAQELATALGAVPNINVAVVDGSLETDQLLSGYGFPATLSAEPTKLNFQSSGNATIEDVRSALDSLGNVRVQTVGVDGSQTFQVRLGIKEGATQDSMETEVKNALNAAFGAGNVVVLQSDYIGPKFSATLLSSSILAIVVAMALILLYIWVRFRFAYAVSSLIALVHDILMMLTIITLFRFEFSGITIAALLTIIGYSLNNTIVIFDRIRENVALAPNVSLSVNIDHSVTQSLSRTVMSAVTTLIAIIPLAIFASGDIQLFALKMGFGILFGTYSSNLLAPAMLYWISNAQAKKKAKKAE
ncbi:MAG: protein translocase subunit SecF [Sphaerochaeta sp.]|jgi:preprotein translocase subunit SecF|uniref:protein translocase subunit SecF n=1 Tax=Sphaerochaeta sp. TaxID=1972642 RepID=UPI003D0A21DF